MTECPHAKKERKTADIVTRNVKIVHKIYRKVETLIKASARELDHHNMHPTLLVVMRELNKNQIGTTSWKALLELATQDVRIIREMSEVIETKNVANAGFEPAT